MSLFGCLLCSDGYDRTNPVMTFEHNRVRNLFTCTGYNMYRKNMGGVNYPQEQQYILVKSVQAPTIRENCGDLIVSGGLLLSDRC